MTKHEDNDDVILGYASSANITFRGELYVGYTWGEWREMSQKEKDEAVDEVLYELVDVWVEDDEYGEDE